MGMGWGDFDLQEGGFNTHDNCPTSPHTRFYCLEPSGGFRPAHMESQEGGQSMLHILTCN